MPNVDTTGKFGRSMDCSTLIELKRKKKHHTEDPRKFNTNQVVTGKQEPASVHYNQRALYVLFSRFSI
jgi:hypothetical protein